jgi:hypothetical protein
MPKQPGLDLYWSLHSAALATIMEFWGFEWQTVKLNAGSKDLKQVDRWQKIVRMVQWYEQKIGFEFREGLALRSLCRCMHDNSDIEGYCVPYHKDFRRMFEAFITIAENQDFKLPPCGCVDCQKNLFEELDLPDSNLV